MTNVQMRSTGTRGSRPVHVGHHAHSGIVSVLDMTEGVCGDMLAVKGLQARMPQIYGAKCAMMSFWQYPFHMTA
jgi:hypothetical protein